MKPADASLIAATFDVSEDGALRVINISEYQRRRQPQRPDAVRQEPRVARLIALRSIPEFVTAAVHFDRQLLGVAIEVEDIAPNGMLLTEVQAV